MCVDCNKIEIPQGPAGTNGSNGNNGTNGLNGTTILYSVNRIGTTSGSGTSEVALASYTIPANTLVTNGDEIEIYAYLEYNSPNQVDINFKLAGLNIFTYAQINANDEKLVFKIKIAKLGTGAQYWTIEKLGLTTAPAIVLLLDDITSSADETIPNIVQITGQNNIAGAAQLTLQKFTVYKYSI